MASGVADRTPAAQNITSRFTGSQPLGWEHQVIWPCALAIAPSDFVFAAPSPYRHRPVSRTFEFRGRLYRFSFSLARKRFDARNARAVNVSLQYCAI
jgi:hypothetical protein